MSGFVAIAIAMTVIALLWVVLPLWRDSRRAEGVALRDSNLSIMRDQLAELARDLGNGTISADQYTRARAELERRALEESGPVGVPTTASSTGPADASSGRGAALALAVLIPAGSLAMYMWIGEPAGLKPQVAAAEQHVTPQQVDDMVASLAAKLKKNPDDARGWAMLGRSYYVMQKMPEAVAAYAKAVEKVTDDAGLYADYADAMAMSQGRRIEGQALELVNKALKVDPEQPKALAMAGTAAFNRKDFAEALKHWGKLLPMLPPESEMAKSVISGIAEARELGGIKGPVAAVGEAKPASPSSATPAEKPAATGEAKGISGRVTLSPALAAKVSPDDTVFILARAVNGPRIPLAVMRKKVADLPIDFTLDDAMAMSPELKLSGFAEVIVSARISKSGNAISASGDLQGASGVVKVGARALAITIDSVLP